MKETKIKGLFKKAEKRGILSTFLFEKYVQTDKNV